MNTDKIERIKNLEEYLSSRDPEAYTLHTAEYVADQVLVAYGYKWRGAVPVKNIAKCFGMPVYDKTIMDENISGNIYVGGTTKALYGFDKVIVVRDGDDICHQRFIVAHELAHYTMEYLPRKKTWPPGKLFSKTYPKTEHDAPIEKLADRFAAELLMPARTFLREYIKASKAAFGDERYIIPYLADYFTVKQSSVKRRIQETVYGG